MIQSVRKELSPDEDSVLSANMRQLRQSHRSWMPMTTVFGTAEYDSRSTGGLQGVRQKVPEGIYQVAAVIYNSLAQCYADTVREIEKIEHVTYPCINIVGGGANAAYLNELTAKATGKTVYAGPTEATAIGKSSWRR